MPVLIITVCYGLMILRLKSVRMLSGSQVSEEIMLLFSHKHELKLVHLVSENFYNLVPEGF